MQLKLMVENMQKRRIIIKKEILKKIKLIRIAGLSGNTFR